MWPRGWVEVIALPTMTAALEWGEWSAARPGRTLPPGKSRYPFYRRLGGPQGRCGRAENLVPTGIRSRTVQPVVSRYTDWATWPTFRLRLTRNILLPRWPRGVRRGSAAARGFESRREHGCLSYFECCVLSGRHLRVGPIIRPEKCYCVWCVWVWSKNVTEEA